MLRLTSRKTPDEEEVRENEAGEGGEGRGVSEEEVLPRGWRKRNGEMVDVFGLFLVSEIGYISCVMFSTQLFIILMGMFLLTHRLVG